MRSLLVQQFLQADGTDVLALEVGDFLGAVAEDTGGLILLQHDGGAIDVDLQGILFCDVQCAAQFDGEDDSPQFVDPADNTCGFHVCEALPFPDWPFFSLSVQADRALFVVRRQKRRKNTKTLGNNLIITNRI